MSVDDRFIFQVEWFDQGASVVRPYYLTYYPIDKTIDMYDIKNKRMFLKRCQYPNLVMEDLFVGSTLTIYSRLLKVVDYGDVYTRKLFEKKRSRTLAIIKPDAYMNIGRILDSIYANGFSVNRMKMLKLSVDQAQGFYAEHRGKPFYKNLTEFMTSDVCVVLELVAESAVEKWRALIGPTNTQVAKETAPSSLRAQFGTDATKNAVHGSDSAVSAARELEFMFGDTSSTTALLDNCSCLVIKPHVVKEGKAGQIITRILEEGFEISALEQYSLLKPAAEEFFDVYKEVLPEYTPMVEHITTGQIIVMEVRQEKVVEVLRNVVGPHDPEIARHLRPDTIRAKFGIDRVKNAVHCTDLPEDGVLECEYFFSILKKKQDDQTSLIM